MNKLNPKQTQFCHEYLKDFNATQAAIRAGYSERSAYSQAHDLLSKPEIKKVIDSLSRENFNMIGLSTQRIVAELAGIAFSEKAKTSDKIKALEALSKFEAAKEDRGFNRDLRGSADRIMAVFSNIAERRPDSDKGITI